MINILLKAFIDKNSKYRFIKQLPIGTELLDVGCGNHSPSKANYLNKSIFIDGIDIVEYNMNSLDKSILRNYFIVSKSNFNLFIKNIKTNYQAIVCSHVLEHVDEHTELLEILLDKLAPNGQLYISFPNYNSIKFPSRKGTLNFFDDETHFKSPPDINIIEKIILQKGCKIINKSVPNKPFLGYILGLLIEPFSRLQRKVLPFTWYYWGFENVYIIKK